MWLETHELLNDAEFVLFFSERSCSNTMNVRVTILALYPVLKEVAN